MVALDYPAGSPITAAAGTGGVVRLADVLAALAPNTCNRIEMTIENIGLLLLKVDREKRVYPP
jgi:hypothetical protein